LRLAVNVARLVGIIIYNKTQSDLEYFGRLALAMKLQVMEEEEVKEGIHTTPYEAKSCLCSRKLGQGARCKMQQLWPKYKINFLISISDFSYHKRLNFFCTSSFGFYQKNALLLLRWFYLVSRQIKFICSSM
jgi:hypothetical protein